MLADETRRRIVELLAERPRPAGELAGQFAISQPAVSRHLRVLRDARLVRAEVAGQQRIYHLEPAPLAELEDWLARYRAFYDLNDLVRQLGILPPAGSRAERATAALQRLQVRLSRR